MAFWCQKVAVSRSYLPSDSPLGGLLGDSWGGVAGLEMEKRSLLKLEQAFGKCQRVSWAEEWPWLEREQDFQGSPKSTTPFGRAARGSTKAFSLTLKLKATQHGGDVR